MNVKYGLQKATQLCHRGQNPDTDQFTENQLIEWSI